MTADSKSNRHQPRSRPLREAFILGAMVLVTMAFGAALIVQFGWPLWMSGLTALAMYVALVSVHALLRRTEAIRELSDEIGRLEDEVSLIRQRTGPGPQLQPASTKPTHAMLAEPKRATPAQSPLTANTPAQRPPRASVESTAPLAASSAGPGIKATAPDSAANGIAAPSRSESPNSTSQAASPASGDGARKDTPPLSHGTDPKTGLSMTRFWAFRPNDPQPASNGPAAQPTLRQTSDGARPPASAPKSTSDATTKTPPPVGELSPAIPAVAGDVGVIGGMIRKFAEEMGPPNPNSAATQVETPKTSNAPALQDIDQSVDALRAAANEMRRPAGSDLTSPIERGVLPPLRPEAIKGPLPPPVNHSHARMAAIADGIATNKFDVYLEPIVALADRKVRHYEINLRLRTEPTGSMGPEDYVPTARGSGMLPFIDAIRVTRAATMARHMDERGSGGSLFVSLTAESLINQGFQWEFAEACRQSARLSERLILAFNQADIRSFSAPHWDAVRQLTGSGFRLAIDDTSSFDPDLPDLKTAGFAFLRFTAQTLIDGMPSLERPLTSASLFQRLADVGLAPIVTAVTTDEQFAKIMEDGLPLGQGSLFGPRLPVKAQVLQPSRNVVAA